MARVSLDPPKTLTYRAAAWFSRRQFGMVIDPLSAITHHGPVTRSYGRFGMAAQRWRKLDTGLKDLATMAAAQTIGCSWCMDFGYWMAVSHGVSAEQIRAVPTWRDSDQFTELERLVLEYAEAMTVTPPAVTDELTAGLRRHLSDAQLVELTAVVAIENLHSRINTALGLTSQGFKDKCELAPAGPAGTSAGG